MILENPAGLWALTAIIAVLILHRLRQRPESRQVSSLIIWKKIARLLTIAPVRKKSRLYLILFLQILAVICLSLALSQPRLTESLREPLHLVFLIDNSASMTTKYNEKRDSIIRWVVMQEKIKEVIDKSPVDTTVSFYQAPPEKSFIGLKRYETNNIIDNLAVKIIPSDLESLVALVQGVKGEFYFYSDKRPPDSLIDKLPGKPHLILVGKPSNNRAIIRASAAPTPNKEDYYDVFVTVKNYSSMPIANALVVLAIERGIKLGSQEVFLGAGEKKDLFFKDIHLPEAPALKVSIKADYMADMEYDDEVLLLPPRPCKINISGKDNPALVRALKAMPSVSLNSPSESGDISIFNETLPVSLPAKAIVINSIPEAKAFWDYQGKIERPLVTGIDTSSPILKYCDLNVFNNIPYAQKLLPREKEYIKPVIQASGSSGDECVLIGEWRKGDKHLVFLNFPLEWRNQTNPTDWTLTPSFPIFWTNLINYFHPISKNYTLGEGLCNEEESDNNGITVLDTNLPGPEQMPQIETSRVELGHWPIIAAGLLFLLGWILAKRN